MFAIITRKMMKEICINIKNATQEALEAEF